jgi:branched-chain amino acid transport system permease protein
VSLRLPAGRPAKLIGLGLLALLLVAVPFLVPDKLQTSINPFLLAAMAAVGLNLLMGSAGEISLGQAAMLAVGAYSAVLLNETFELPFVVGVLFAAPVGALISAVVGLTTARLKGLYAVLSTVALQFVVIYAAQRYQAKSNFGAGFTLPVAEIAGWRLDEGWRWYVVLAPCAILACLAHRQLLRTHVGRAWTAIRDRSSMAATLGVPLARYRLLAFALSGALVSMAGALLGYYQGAVAYDTYTLNLAVVYLAIIVVGGRGIPSGPFWGAAVFILLPTELRALLRSVNPTAASNPLVAQWEQVFDGFVLIVFLSLAPMGVAGGLLRLRRRITHRDRPIVLGEEAEVEAAPPAVVEQVPARVNSGPSLLEVERVAAGYSGAGRALHDVSLRVERGEVVAVLGPNGAGKTTLLRAIAGFTRLEGGSVHAGSIRFDGNDIGSTSAFKRARSGLVMVPERNKVFAEMTVSENMHVAMPRHDPSRIDEVLDLFPQLKALADRPAVLLSGGERQMLAIARALLLRPKVLCLDETTLGLAPRVARAVMQQLRELAEQTSTGVLLVEQNVHLALDISDRFYVLARGRIAMEGSPSVTAADELMTAYFGWEPADD